MPTPVYLKVYEFSKHNGFATRLGLGVFHSTVKVGKYEYEWGYDAQDIGSKGKIVQCTRSSMGVYLYKSYYIGETHIYCEHEDEWNDIAFEIAKSRGPYNAFSNNCNHFAEAFCRRLCNKGIKSYINRAAGFAEALVWG